MVPEFRRVPGFVLDVEQGLEPLDAQAPGGGFVGVRCFVQPMRGDPRFGHHVHCLGSHLKFDVYAGRADQRGVQGLIAIELGDRDVVLEAARHRLVQLMQHAERGVAVGHGRHNDPKTVDVGHLGEAQVLVVHLAINGIQGFLATCDADLHADGGKGRLHFATDFLDQVASPVARTSHRFGQDGISPRPQVTEREVLQFAVGLVEPKPVGDGRVDLQGFSGNSSPFRARHVAHGPHVVRAIGKLDQDHTHVTRHGEQHLAKRLGLVLFAGVKLQPVQFGEPIHQLGNRSAKTLDQVGLGDAAVLHGVVQQRGHERVGIELPLGALNRHGNRVGDVGLAAVSELPEVGLIGIAIRTPDQFHIACTEIVHSLGERGKTRRRCVGRGERTTIGLSGRGWCRFGGDDRAHPLTVAWTT